MRICSIFLLSLTLPILGTEVDLRGSRQDFFCTTFTGPSHFFRVSSPGLGSRPSAIFAFGSQNLPQGLLRGQTVTDWKSEKGNAVITANARNENQTLTVGLIVKPDQLKPDTVIYGWAKLGDSYGNQIRERVSLYCCRNQFGPMPDSKSCMPRETAEKTWRTEKSGSDKRSYDSRALDTFFNAPNFSL